MELGSWLPMIGYGGVGLTLVSWLAGAFSAGDKGSPFLSWTGAIGLYAALFAFFLTQLLGSLEDGWGALSILFGFFTLMFGSGLMLAIWRTASSLAGSGGSDEHAAH